MAYEYNGLGERISKQMNGADKTQYVYNNKKLIGEYTANGYVDYIYIGDLLVAINKDNSIFYVHNDHLNTPRKVTNTHNVVVFDWPAVDPFGANQPTINTIGFNIRYPGQYYDTETAYHYNYHRYYNPKTGKYLQADPIGLDGGYNLYNYVDNNSLIGVDPEGLYTGILIVEGRNNIDIGHVGLQLNGTVYDLNPDTVVKAINVLTDKKAKYVASPVENFIRKYTTREYSPNKNGPERIHSFQINITKEQEIQLENYLENIRPQKYNALAIGSNNCVTLVSGAISSILNQDLFLGNLPSIMKIRLWSEMINGNQLITNYHIYEKEN